MDHEVEGEEFDTMNSQRLQGWFYGYVYSFSVDVKLRLSTPVYYFDIQERQAVVHFRLQMKNHAWGHVDQKVVVAIIKY